MNDATFEKYKTQYKYYNENKDEINAKLRNKRKENPEHFREQGRRNREKHIEYYSEYRENNKEDINIRNKGYRERDKNLVISKYGEVCECCGQHIKEFLAIDHIDGIKTDGWPRSGGTLYRKLIKENYPTGFRVLCHNCNLSLGIYGYCPHKTEFRKEIDKKRVIVLKHYGEKCSCCGETNIEFLAIDHKMGDGADEKRKGIKGRTLVRHIIKNNFPDKYRILCHNCNTACGTNKTCPHIRIKESV